VPRATTAHGIELDHQAPFSTGKGKTMCASVSVRDLKYEWLGKFRELSAVFWDPKAHFPAFECNVTSELLMGCFLRTFSYKPAPRGL
jgi:hypothetical protein